ncbi:TonB-dependent receptor domain-containing protein [Nonlabens ponticola]|uniref:TonB-dependent receptor n=1 Tax=Nonlabens ponticola TaxID=2496866 RepID=A0A3S9MVK7_9FLAO|nr:TonB-dependent receptor [Nonlabens ponticola]AZQ43169.1 TonB-dependent receptor [Nonlabens ponticola]
MKLFYSLLLGLLCISATAQHELTGTVKDSDQNAFPYANVLLYKMPDSTFYKATITDDAGRFEINVIDTGEYTLVSSFVGMIPLSRKLTIDKDLNITDLILQENTEQLEGVTVTARRPTIEKRPDRFIFNVENSSLSIGNTQDILKQTPGIFEMNGSYMVQNSPAVIYINNKRVYLTSDELNQLLTGYSADNIKSVEVITNPPARYDAEGAAVININTSKGISLGYKGSINGEYTIDRFAKYQIGTSQFYKNNWINVYFNYNYNPRKDFKLDESQIGFFNDNGSRNSRWFTDFEKETVSDAHNFNTLLDFTLNENNSLSINANLTVNQNQDIDTDVETFILPSGSFTFDGFNTDSDLTRNRNNGFANIGWLNTFNEGSGTLSLEANYIFTDRDQTQDLSSRFFDENGDTTGTNSFFTDALQDINIGTGKLDFSNTFGAYVVGAGLKYSDVNSTSELLFFDTNGGSGEFRDQLSDRFIYDENIYAAYLQLDRDWENWALSLGLRAEQTDVEGDSRSLGQVNTQEYFELFPNVSLTKQTDQNNLFTLSYKRSIERPRYESLNPFSYFINDNNVNTGNPNLQPAFTNKVNLNWTHKGQYIFDLYYTRTNDALAILPFQNNDNFTLNSQNANLDYELQYSLDFTTIQYLNQSWFLQAQSSLFYMENEFTAVQSGGVKQQLDVTGFYLNIFNRITLSKDRTFSVDVQAGYLTNYLSGSYEFKDQLTTSVGFYKSLWNNRAAVTLNFNDLFLSQNQPLVSRYLNQDNRFLALPETNTIALGFTYKFGNFRLSNRDVATPEDQERTGTRTSGF